MTSIATQELRCLFLALLLLLLLSLLTSQWRLSHQASQSYVHPEETIVPLTKVPGLFLGKIIKRRKAEPQGGLAGISAIEDALTGFPQLEIPRKNTSEIENRTLDAVIGTAFERNGTFNGTFNGTQIPSWFNSTASRFNGTESELDWDETEPGLNGTAADINQTESKSNSTVADLLNADSDVDTEESETFSGGSTSVGIHLSDNEG